MITLRALTLIQLAFVAVGLAFLWRWPWRARGIIAATVTACFAIIGFYDPYHWRSAIGPTMAIFALLLLSWTLTRR
jgi:hypothetical protein